MRITKKASTEKAMQGESLRLAGNYSKAIECFSEAIAQNPNYFWAYAHRAAARGPLGSFREAYADFARAREYYHGYNYEWFLGQKAELFRLWARAILMGHEEYHEEQTLLVDADLAGVPPDPWENQYIEEGGTRALPPAVVSAFSQMSIAIRLFTKANTLRETNPWTLAHRGATRTMRYWVGRPTLRFRAGCDEDFASAEADFQSAYGANESYGWAYAYHAILRALRSDDKTQQDTKKAIELIGQAHTNGLERQLSLMRVLMELTINNHDDAGDMSGLETTTRLAWNTLLIDSEESFARYFIANGLTHHLPPGHPDAKAAITRARAELNGARARLLALEGGLDCLEEKYSDATAKLEELRSHFDLDALALVTRDPAWEPLRNGTAPDHMEKHDELRKARDWYGQLFNY